MKRLFSRLCGPLLAVLAVMVVALPALALQAPLEVAATPVPGPVPASPLGFLVTLALQYLTPDTVHKAVIAVVGVLAALITQGVKLSEAKVFSFLPPNSTGGARVFSLVLALVLMLVAQAIGGPAANIDSLSQALVEAFFAWLVSYGVYKAALKPHN